MRVVLAIVALVLVGCASSGPSPSDGVARQVSPDRARSIAEVQIETAVAALWDQPALHADIHLDDGGDGAVVGVELDTASGRWRAQHGEAVLSSIDEAGDPRLAQALTWATTPDAVDAVAGARHEALTTRAGRYGLEDGHRLAAPDADTVEIWISQDSGLVTDVVLLRDGVVVAFTPLPAPLMIAG
ncbi:MAG: hypothetical protein OEU32_19220 [Acidimicrobiia bacterium]|nr:hypothetical protein [Acidimicrobiia bacterium]